jgi:hypothetical protein
MKILTKFSVAVVIALLSACSPGGEKADTAKDSSTVDTLTNMSADSVRTNQGLLLVPGSSAGKLSIGQDAREAYAELGKADAGDAAMQKSVAIWYKDHDPKSYATAIYTVRDTGANPSALIRQIRVTSPAFKTADAIGVSSTLGEIQKKYTLNKITDVTDSGTPLELYDSMAGIAFETDSKGICRAVIIHKADEGLKLTSLPLR